MLLRQYKFRISSYNNISQDAKFIENSTIGIKYIKEGEWQ